MIQFEIHTHTDLKEIIQQWQTSRSKRRRFREGVIDGWFIEVLRLKIGATRDLRVLLLVIFLDTEGLIFFACWIIESSESSNSDPEESLEPEIIINEFVAVLWEAEACSTDGRRSDRRESGDCITNPGGGGARVRGRSLCEDLGVRVVERVKGSLTWKGGYLGEI